jgi:hypothetical protein
MDSLSEVRQRNRELAEQINREALGDPSSRYNGKFVGMANGQIVVVADSLDEMAKRLRQVEPDPQRTFGIEASRDYSVVEELWPLRADRPTIQVVLSLARTGQDLVRHLLADTGAGTALSGFELLLAESDCLRAGGNPVQSVSLGGAYSGTYPVYSVRARIPAIGFDQDVSVVGVTSVPRGLDGLACFRFLNRFTYGNFGDSGRFALVT